MSHFAPEEFRCRCQRPDCDALTTVTPDLLARLDAMRERYGAPLLVTSGLRCRWWNGQQGGTPDSEHLYGEAADLACTASERRWEMLEAALGAGIVRLGIATTFLHVGVGRALAQRVIWTYPR